MRECKYCGSYPKNNPDVLETFRCGSIREYNPAQDIQSRHCKTLELGKVKARIAAMTAAGDAMARLLRNDQINAQTIIGKQTIPAFLKAWDKANGRYE